MKKTITITSLAAICTVLAGCHAALPGAGEEAVIIRKPFIAPTSGVDDTPVTTGRKWLFATSTKVYVNMQPRTLVVHFDDMMTKDGVPLDFDAGLEYRITDSVCIVKDFGGVSDYQPTPGNNWPVWFFNNLYKPMETAMRQAVRKHGLNETAIQPTAVEEIDAEITEVLQREIATKKLCIELRGFTVGRANPPDAVKNQRVETAREEQRINTENQRKLAEDKRKAAEASRAEADNAYRNSLGLTADQFVTLQRINMEREVCIKQACTFIAQGVGAVISAR